MEGKGKSNISDYRRKLDKTLASPDLTNDGALHNLVKKQMLRSSDLQLDQGGIENVVERRSKELSNSLGMLRSAGVDDAGGSGTGRESHGAWKLKQDTEEFRVMYREGPAGTPFHSLLVEGYIDAPLDVCLCVSWESGLYQKWWPQTSIPTFKVESSRCVKGIRTGEQISLVRMKVSWPLSSREALTHYFTFEYLQDDLVVVLLNSISDTEPIDRSSHGFTRDGIPDAEEVVRIDVVGGFAIQKVSADRSYFRTITNIDIKLDFVPPSFINFVARQLIGSGFKLFKKEVASASRGHKEFKEALKGPLYSRVREALYAENPIKCTPDMPEEEHDEVIVGDINERNEIEEQVISSKGDEAIRPANGSAANYGPKMRKNGVSISPDVEQALETLDKAISVLQARSGNSEEGGGVGSANIDKEADQIKSRHNGSNSHAKETRQSKIVPDEEQHSTSATANSNSISLHSSINQKIDGNSIAIADANEGHGNRASKRKNKGSRICCLRAFAC